MRRDPEQRGSASALLDSQLLPADVLDVHSKELESILTVACTVGLLLLPLLLCALLPQT